jgi:hypothetical protein
MQKEKRLKLFLMQFAPEMSAKYENKQAANPNGQKNLPVSLLERGIYEEKRRKSPLSPTPRGIYP